MTTPDAAMRPEGAPPRVAWYRDWRVWLGVAVTVACVWYSMRDVPLAAVARAMAHANLPLLLILSAPGYVGAVYYRALRWRHLTNPIADIPRTTMFNAQAIGFMVNNVVPLRIGELVRSFYLARHERISAGAVLGTVVLERVIDVACVLALASLGLYLAGSGSEESGLLETGARLLLPVAVAPLAALVTLRVAPEWVIRMVRRAARPFPEGVGVWLERLLRSFTQGLGAIRGGWHLFWLCAHSVTIWLVFSILPVIAALVAFDIELGSPVELITVSWIILAATGVAVAIPSAPGFFGPYQLAYKAVLVRLGVDPATALAIGLLSWFLFWVFLTSQGLAVLRLSRISLSDLTRQASKDPPPERR